MGNWKENLREELEVSESPEWKEAASKFTKGYVAKIESKVASLESQIPSKDNCFLPRNYILEPIQAGFQLYLEERKEPRSWSPILKVQYLDSERRQLKIWFEQRKSKPFNEILFLLLVIQPAIALVASLVLGVNTLFIMMLCVLPMQLVFMYQSVRFSNQVPAMITLLHHFCKSLDIELYEIRFEAPIVS